MIADISGDLRLRVVDQLIEERRREADEARTVHRSAANRTPSQRDPRRLAMAAVIAALLALVGAGSIRAASIDVSRFEVEDGAVFTDACGPGLDLIGEFTLRATIIVMVRDDGTPYRERLHVDFFGTLTRSDTGRSISDPTHATVTFDLVAGTRTETGLTIRRTYPGLGLFAHDVGRLVAVDASGDIVFLAGPHDVLLGGSSIPAVCAALG